MFFYLVIKPTYEPEYVSNPCEYPTQGIEGPKVEDLSPGFEGYLSLGKSLKTSIERSRFEIMFKVLLLD